MKHEVLKKSVESKINDCLLERRLMFKGNHASIPDVDYSYLSGLNHLRLWTGRFVLDSGSEGVFNCQFDPNGEKYLWFFTRPKYSLSITYCDKSYQV